MLTIRRLVHIVWLWCSAGFDCIFDKMAYCWENRLHVVRGLRMVKFLLSTYHFSLFPNMVHPLLFCRDCRVRNSFLCFLNQMNKVLTVSVNTTSCFELKLSAFGTRLLWLVYGKRNSSYSNILLKCFCQCFC